MESTAVGWSPFCGAFLRCIRLRYAGKIIHGIYGSSGAEHFKMQVVRLLGLQQCGAAHTTDHIAGGNRIAVKSDPTLVTGHASMVENIVDAVIEGKDPQILPLEAIKSVRIVNAVYESARTGKTIYFE